MRWVVVAVLLVLLAGCGSPGGERAGPRPTTTTALPPPSTAPPTTLGEATGDLADGRHAAYLRRVDLRRRTVTFDVIQFLGGEEARKAYEEETGDPSGPPNDFFIKNENPKLRTYPVARAVSVTLVRLAEDADAGSSPGTFEELPTYLAGYRSPETGWAPLVFWLTVRGGTIVAIDEQYTP